MSRKHYWDAVNAYERMNEDERADFMSRFSLKSEDAGAREYEVSQFFAASNAQQDFEALSAAVNELRQQREYWQAKVQQLTQAFTDVFLSVVAQDKHSLRVAQKKSASYHRIADQQPVTQLSMLIAKIYEDIDSANADQHNAELALLPPNAEMHPREYLFALIDRAKLVATRQHAIQALDHAIALSHYIPLIAEDILRECGVWDAPTLKTVQRLALDWITNNLPNPPTTYGGLSKGLGWAQKFKKTGKTMTIFVDLHQVDISYSTLRRYVGWYEELDKMRKTTEFLPNMTLRDV